MKKIVTKQELLESNTRLQVALTDATQATAKIKIDFDSRDKEIRIEFAKAFGWRKKGSYFSEDWHLPTWQEIFIEQGKLLSGQNFQEQNKSIESIQGRLNEIDNRLFELEK